MENSQVRKKRTLSLSLFSVLSSEKAANSIKSPRIFEAGVVGLGIVAAMSDAHDYDASLPSKKALSPRSTPMPIPIVSSAKPAVNFLKPQREEADEFYEGYTCVISHLPNDTIKKCFYFDDELNGVADHFSYPTTAMLTNGVFSASPATNGDDSTEFWTADFLEFCDLCNKQLHGVDIFMYRGDRAFCSAECRESYMRKDGCKEKEKRRSSAPIKSLDCSMSPCSGPPVSFAGVVAA